MIDYVELGVHVNKILRKFMSTLATVVENPRLDKCSKV